LPAWSPGLRFALFP